MPGPDKTLLNIHYQYVETSGGYAQITRRFANKKDTIQQSFYSKNGSLIYATEKITTYFTDMGKIDSIVWAGNFYFSKNKLIANVTFGYGKSEIDSWNPEVDLLKAFSESK